MLDQVVLNFELPLTWTADFMPKENKKRPVEVIDNGFGEDTVVYRVGQKLMYVTMREDSQNNVFITMIDGAYVKDLKKERSYWVPSTFETDKEGRYLKVSREDEKALIDQLVKDQLTGIEYRKKKGIRPIKQRIVGTHYSAEDQAIYKNPSSPKTPPKPRRDKKLAQ